MCLVELIRPARPEDADAIGRITVASWRSAYAGLLPEGHLAGMSVRQQVEQARGAIGSGRAVLVAEADGLVVGFCTVGRCRTKGLADGEVETLYVLDDFRDRGLGRGLLVAGAERMSVLGCRSLVVWVLSGNGARWFYERMGGRAVSTDMTRVAGRPFELTAYKWDPLASLIVRG